MGDGGDESVRERTKEPTISKPVLRKSETRSMTIAACCRYTAVVGVLFLFQQTNGKQIESKTKRKKNSHKMNERTNEHPPNL